jgi:NADH-quinone oxidoreductase subunit H
VSLLCIHAKIGYVPFDMAEAETELGSGVLMEYSGGLLALWNLTSAMMLVALPMFLVLVFLGGFGVTVGSIADIAVGLLKYVGVLVLIILIKNTNPRVRIDQAMRFFWIWCGLTLVAAIVLATIGNIYGIGWL